MQTLDIISVNLWQILISLANLLIIFLILKKFLYKPVKKVMEERRQAIDSDYSEAAEAKRQALSDKKAYEEKLSGANGEAERIIRSAVEAASFREKEMMDEARAKADGILRKAEADVVLERKKAEADIRREIVEVSTLVSEKMLRREMSADDHKRLVDSFIDSIGDGDEAE
ncbi:MAG: F0F1 ATP synthase subunit B [Clostridia bacterium]|nr:F0F1 ATP synthase subunit B [Clostridia bacterium]